MAKNEKHLLSAEPPSFVRIANSIKPKPNLLNANKILFLLRWISIAIQTTLQTHNIFMGCVKWIPKCFVDFDSICKDCKWIIKLMFVMKCAK